MKNQNVLSRLFVIVSILFFTGCATTSTSTQQSTEVLPTTAGGPCWVDKGCQCQEQNENIFCGVGFASTVGDYVIGREAADATALKNLQRSMEVAVEDLLEDYKNRELSGDPNAAGIMKKFEKAMKTVIGGTLRGAKIVDHWENPARKLLFSLAKVDLSLFKKKADKMNELSEEFKEHVRKNAERMQEKLDKKLEKRK